MSGPASAPAEDNRRLFFFTIFIAFLCLGFLVDSCSSSDESDIEELSRKLPNRRKGSPLKGGDKNDKNSTKFESDVVSSPVTSQKIKTKPTKPPKQPSKIINKRHQVKPLSINDPNRFLSSAVPKKRVDRCPLCDSSVYSYCSDKLLHDACCCLSPYETALPYQCQYADCSFLHANSCREHHLITACCCDKVVYL